MRTTIPTPIVTPITTLTPTPITTSIITPITTPITTPIQTKIPIPIITPVKREPKFTSLDIKRKPDIPMPGTRKKLKKSSKILNNVINVLDSAIEKSSEWAYPSLPPGERSNIIAKEYEIENISDNIKLYENKFKNNNLTLVEYRKFSNDIDEMKQHLPKKEQELHEAKRELEKEYGRL